MLSIQVWCVCVPSIQINWLRRIMLIAIKLIAEIQHFELCSLIKRYLFSTQVEQIVNQLADYRKNCLLDLSNGLLSLYSIQVCCDHRKPTSLSSLLNCNYLILKLVNWLLCSIVILPLILIYYKYIWTKYV